MNDDILDINDMVDSLNVLDRYDEYEDRYTIEYQVSCESCVVQRRCDQR